MRLRFGEYCRFGWTALFKLFTPRMYIYIYSRQDWIMPTTVHHHVLLSFVYNNICKRQQIRENQWTEFGRRRRNLPMSVTRNSDDACCQVRESRRATPRDLLLFCSTNPFMSICFLYLYVTKWRAKTICCTLTNARDAITRTTYWTLSLSVSSPKNILYYVTISYITIIPCYSEKYWCVRLLPSRGHRTVPDDGSAHRSSTFLATRKPAHYYYFCRFQVRTMSKKKGDSCAGVTQRLRAIAAVFTQCKRWQRPHLPFSSESGAAFERRESEWALQSLCFHASLVSRYRRRPSVIKDSRPPDVIVITRALYTNTNDRLLYCTINENLLASRVAPSPNDAATFGLKGYIASEHSRGCYRRNNVSFNDSASPVYKK